MNLEPLTDRCLPLVGQSESLEGVTAEECKLLMSRYSGALGAFQFLQRYSLPLISLLTQANFPAPKC